MPNYISPHYRDTDIPSPPSIDEAITILEDQVKGWFLDVAQKLVNDRASDFVVLMIITSYFEEYEILRSGKDSNHNSKEFFQAGFKDFLDSLAVTSPNEANQLVSGLVPSENIVDEFTKAVYVQMRCGLFHIGMTRQVQLSRSLPPGKFFRVSYDEHSELYHFAIDVKGMLEAVIRHFESYLASIRDRENIEKREKFKDGWNIRVSLPKGRPSELTIS